MDEKLLLDSISKHMELLSSLHLGMLTTAVAAIYMAVTEGEELDLKIVKVRRDNAAILVISLFLILMTAIFLSLIRVYGLLELLPANQTNQTLAALTIITTSSWLFNPFAYFGNGFFYNLVSLFSLFGLVVTWWVIFLSTSVIRGKVNRIEIFFMIAFNALSLLTFGMIQQIYFLLVDKTTLVNQELSVTLSLLKDSRLSIVSWTSLFGLIVSLVIVYFVSKRRPPDALDVVD